MIGELCLDRLGRFESEEKECRAEGISRMICYLLSFLMCRSCEV